MSKIKCVILDDESMAREIIGNFVKQISFLELVAVAEDSTEALEILQTNTVDLLITDIQMPGINGLQLVQSLPSPPKVIFITAHENFAAKGFELDVIDYLLKPVSFERFLKAINKARVKITGNSPDLLHPARYGDGIFIKMNDKLVKVPFVDILYFQAAGDFIKIFLSPTGHYLIHSTIKGIQEKLPPPLFVRIHNSYIVAITAIVSLTKDSVQLPLGIELPVSRSYKEELVKRMIIS
jgi:two-component system, LytTR family, response regulator